MTKFVEAIYSHGIFEPLEALDLPEKQRVELVVRPLGEATQPDAPSAESRSSDDECDAALAELFAEIDRMDLRLRIRMPTRDELYERG